MLGGPLFGCCRERNELLNATWFAGTEHDPWQPFRALIEQYRPGACVVVDLGAGPVDACQEWLSAGYPQPSQARPEIVLSVDEDWGSLKRNPGKYRVLADARCLPFRENSVDLALSRYALEHLPDPLAMIKEVARVLKPGRPLIFVTPHRWCYVSVLGRLTPLWFHRLVYRLLGHAGDGLPFCPTYYRLNTPGTIRTRAKELGLQVSQLEITVGPPVYTKIFPPALHRVFIWFHALLERSPRLRYYLGINLFGVLQKQSVPPRKPVAERT
jgi:SAM-dependent methyltransferase